MSTSVNGTSMDSKICTHVFENPHLGADFVPFMNKTTLFSETHLSICVLSSGPRVAFAGRAKPRAVFFFFWVVEWKSPRRRNEEDDDDVVVDDDDDDGYHSNNNHYHYQCCYYYFWEEMMKQEYSSSS